MKKNISMFMAVILIFVSCVPGTHAASSSPIRILINGNELTIPEGYGTPFYDSSSRLQIPMRFILESCGYTVTWDEAKQTATIPTVKGDVVVTIGSRTLKTPFGNVQMDTSAVIKSDRTYIPLRFALEALDFKVMWEQAAGYDRVTIDGVVGGISGNGLKAAAVAEVAAPAVFYLGVYLDNNLFASGSGFFIDPSGIAVTNYHVIEDTTSAAITMTDGSQYPVEEVLYYNPEWDVAVIRVSQISSEGIPRSIFPYLKMGDSSSINNGDEIYTIGSPLGLQNTISDGIVSNKKRMLEDGGLSVIQISAPISPGSSGGALLNSHAEVIGITSSGYDSDYGQNLNFAVPINCLNGISFSGRTPYVQVYTTEYMNGLSQPVASLGERLYTEPSSCDFSFIDNGDTFLGTFSNSADVDYYFFYTPIPMNVTVLCSVTPTVDYSDLDSASLSRIALEKAAASSLSMGIDVIPGQTAVPGKQVVLSSGITGRVISMELQPGGYYIDVRHDDSADAAWRDRQYFVYLAMQAA